MAVASLFAYPLVRVLAQPAQFSARGEPSVPLLHPLAARQVAVSARSLDDAHLARDHERQTWNLSLMDGL